MVSELILGAFVFTLTLPALGEEPNKNKSKDLAHYLELDHSIKDFEVTNFDIQNRDIRDVVTLISKWTGKNFIIDKEVSGKITIVGPANITLQEAYNAFLAALESNELTTIQSGKFIRIIRSANAYKSPIKTYAGDFAPDTEQFITRIISLKYIDARRVSTEFRDMISSQGRILAYEGTNSLIITDSGSNISRIQGILNSLDIKSFETTLRVLRIQNGSAKSISGLLGEVYGDSKQKGASQSFAKSDLEKTRGGGIITKIMVDEVTNSLVVLANEAGFSFLAQIVQKLDTKTTERGGIHVYYCEYAKAEDLAATLSALSAPKSEKITSQKKFPKITSDIATNSLVIASSSTEFKSLRPLLKKLDIPRLQVFVEIAIMEISMNPKTNLNVNTALGAPGARGFAGGFIGDVGSIATYLAGGALEGATIPLFGGPTFTGNVKLPNSPAQSVSVNTFMGLLNFIKKTTQTSILSTPQIIALDNEKATFKVQDKIPVQSSFTSNALSGIGTGNITTMDTGIEINLTPQINAVSRTIRLQIEQKVDTLSSNNNVPDLLKKIQQAKTSRATNTSVVVHDEDYVMLGGLMSDQTDVTENKVPLLGDIPILGWLFKSKQTNVEKRNLVILLRPRIIDTMNSGATLISEKLEERDDFIKRYANEEEAKIDGVGDIKKRLKEKVQSE